MQWPELYRLAAEKLDDNPALADQRPFVLIDSNEQRLYWIDRDAGASCSFPISTARNGMGNRIDSNMTPLGLHRIRQKIGAGEPQGMVFKGRVATGRVAANLDNREQDEITSRILWLDGLEEGLNRNGDCDTYARYIYIHGTSDEARIGEPVSAGCVRMCNLDVVELFDRVEVDDLVFIR